MSGSSTVIRTALPFTLSDFWAIVFSRSGGDIFQLFLFYQRWNAPAT
jgi:hypothetical protein